MRINWTRSGRLGTRSSLIARNSAVVAYSNCHDIGTVRYGTRCWLLSDGSGGCQRRKTNPPQQVLKTWIVTQVVHARIEINIDEPVGMLFITFLQVFDRAF